MDLLNYQYLDKMNNNIGILCYEGDSNPRMDSRMQSMSAFVTNHRTGPPPISPGKRKYSGEQFFDNVDCDSEHVVKMSRLFASQISKSVSGQYRRDPRELSRSPVERASAPSTSLQSGLLYTPMPSLALDQPLALTKHSMGASRTATVSSNSSSPVERQQNRPSVITCAPASNRNCNLSHCPMSSNSGCSPPFKKPAFATTTSDPVIEEHFRRSLGKNYKEPELTNSVSITGSVDDHFAKALGEAWHQIKAKGSEVVLPSHVMDRNNSPSMVS